MLIKLSVTISASPPQVFDIMTNTRLMKKWMLDLTSVKEINGNRSRPGHKSKLVFGTGDKALEVEETIVQIDKPKTLKLELFSRTMRSKQSFQLESLPENKTRINARIQVALRPVIIGFFIFFLAPSIRKQQEGDLKRLKRIIEERN